MGKEDLRLVQPMLQALKSGCETEIAKYEDLVSLDIQDYIFNKLPVIDMRAKLQDKKEKIAQERQKIEPTKVEKLIISLINLDINEKDAERATKYVLNKSPNSKISELMKEALQYIKDKGSKKKKVVVEDKNKLKCIIDEGKKNRQSAYEALNGEGYIKDPLKEFNYKESR